MFWSHGTFFLTGILPFALCMSVTLLGHIERPCIALLCRPYLHFTTLLLLFPEKKSALMKYRCTQTLFHNCLRCVYETEVLHSIGWCQTSYPERATAKAWGIISDSLKCTSASIVKTLLPGSKSATTSTVEITKAVITQWLFAQAVMYRVGF